MESKQQPWKQATPIFDPADLEAARRILDDIKIKRDYPGPGRPTAHPVSRRRYTIATDVLEKLDKLEGAASHHSERAMRFYFTVTKESY